MSFWVATTIFLEAFSYAASLYFFLIAKPPKLQVTFIKSVLSKPQTIKKKSTLVIKLRMFRVTAKFLEPKNNKVIANSGKTRLAKPNNHYCQWNDVKVCGSGLQQNWPRYPRVIWCMRFISLSVRNTVFPLRSPWFRSLVIRGFRKKQSQLVQN